MKKKTKKKQETQELGVWLTFDLAPLLKLNHWIRESRNKNEEDLSKNRGC